VLYIVSIAWKFIIYFSSVQLICVCKMIIIFSLFLLVIIILCRIGLSVFSL